MIFDEIPHTEPLLTSEQLDDTQRTWHPVDLLEAAGQWPNAWKVEVFDGAIHYTDGSPTESKWDWRSVALAAHTYPGHLVQLWPGLVTVHISPPVL